MTDSSTTTASAIEIAAAVHRGAHTPVDVVRSVLQRVEAHVALGALHEVFAQEALAAAARLADRADLATLPLVGLPILIKDNVPVAGHPTRDGSQATSAEPASDDHEVVRRLRAAGVIIIGSTRVPELCIRASTGHHPQPMEPAARVRWIIWRLGGSGGRRHRAGRARRRRHGLDTYPGSEHRVVWHQAWSWCGASRSGLRLLGRHGRVRLPLATTVADAALVLSVMAAAPALASVAEPAAPLRIAVAFNTPSFLVRLHPTWRRALSATAGALREAGHSVKYTRFPYPVNPLPLFARWFAGVADDARGLDPDLLEPRTRRHVHLGRVAQRRGWMKPQDAERLAATTRQFFTQYDILLTPMLARTAPYARQWHRRSWLRNIWSNLRYASYAALCNMLGWPAASIPAGVDVAGGMPMAVQAVAPLGGEAALLGLAAQLERLRPWPRTAPAGE